LAVDRVVRADLAWQDHLIISLGMLLISALIEIGTEEVIRVGGSRRVSHEI
jgi:hypothetical protein